MLKYMISMKGPTLSTMLLHKRAYTTFQTFWKKMEGSTFQAFDFVKGSTFQTFYSVKGSCTFFVNFTTQRVLAFMLSIPVWFGPACPTRGVSMLIAGENLSENKNYFFKKHRKIYPPPPP